MGARSTGCSVARSRWRKRSAPTPPRWARLATSMDSPSATGRLNPSDRRLTMPARRSETTPAHLVILVAGVAIAVAVRWPLLPTPDLPDDLGQFGLRLHGI